MSATVLVTGATGMVGRALTAALVARGDRVVALVRDPAGADPGWEAVRGDVLDDASLARAFAGPEIETVFHLAGAATVGAAARAPADAWEVNVRGTQLVLDAARAAGVRRAVVASTIRVYGDAGGGRAGREDAPLRATDPYGASKAAADELARCAGADGFAVAAVRASNLYGPGDRNASRLVPEAIASALAGRAPVLRSDGTPRRDLLHVDDAVAAYLAVADALGDGRAGAGAAGEAFDVGAGETHAVGAVAALVCELAGCPVASRLLGQDAAPDDDPVDAAKLRALTGWRPRIGLREGLAATIAAARDHR